MSKRTINQTEPITYIVTDTYGNQDTIIGVYETDIPGFETEVQNLQQQWHEDNVPYSFQEYLEENIGMTSLEFRKIEVI